MYLTSERIRAIAEHADDLGYLRGAHRPDCLTITDPVTGRGVTIHFAEDDVPFIAGHD